MSSINCKNYKGIAVLQESKLKMRDSSWTFPHPHSKHPPTPHNGFWILAPPLVFWVSPLWIGFSWSLLRSAIEMISNPASSIQSPHISCHLSPQFQNSHLRAWSWPHQRNDIVALKSDSPLLKSAACLLQLWVSYLLSPCLDFHICKMVILTMFSRLL